MLKRQQGSNINFLTNSFQIHHLQKFQDQTLHKMACERQCQALLCYTQVSQKRRLTP